MEENTRKNKTDNGISILTLHVHVTMMINFKVLNICRTFIEHPAEISISLYQVIRVKERLEDRGVVRVITVLSIVIVILIIPFATSTPTGYRN